MATAEEKIAQLYQAKILSNRLKEAMTRVFVANEDVTAVITSMKKPTPPAQPRQPRAPQSHTGEPSKTTLFVANLPFAVDDEGLLDIFEGQKVKEARVAVRRDGHSRGYGFVTFDNEADMREAQNVVDKTLVENREISVRVVLGEMNDRKPAQSAAPAPVSAPAPAAEASKLVAFVGNLPFTVDDAKLLELFEGYAVKEAKVSVRANGHSKGYALVTFEKEEDQAKAVAALNGTQFEGRPIHVLASTKGLKQPRKPRACKEIGEASKTTLFVANLPFIVDDSGLLQIFDGFQVKEAHVAVRGLNKSCGFGFVSFETEAEAQRALSTVDKSIVENREIAVRPAHSLQATKASTAPAVAVSDVAAAPAPVAVAAQ
jgi:RNA recognition motif-containing protein